MKTAFLFFLSLLPACAAFSEDVASKAHEDDIRETVFRHQIADANNKSEFHFLSLRDKDGKAIDPSPQFLKRFKDLGRQSKSNPTRKQLGKHLPSKMRLLLSGR